MKELLEKLENLPSILSIEDELFFIDRLQTLPIDEICKNKEYLRELSQLYKSLTKTTGYLK